MMVTVHNGPKTLLCYFWNNSVRSKPIW